MSSSYFESCNNSEVIHYICYFSLITTNPCTVVFVVMKCRQ